MLFTFPQVIEGSSISLIILCSLGNFLFGVSAMLINTPMTIYLQNNVPMSKQGSVYTILISTSQIFIPIGTIIYGFFI